jgi:hypothetical protein
MRIKKDRGEEFAAWMAYMQSKGEITAISFFNLLCQNSDQGYDAVVIVSNVLMHIECDRPYEATNYDVYMAMCAFSDFHENGDDFRRRWNMGSIGVDYAKYVEEGVIKHVAQPFAYHSIFEWKIFASEDDGEDDGDDGQEGYDGWKNGR